MREHPDSEPNRHESPLFEPDHAAPGPVQQTSQSEVMETRNETQIDMTSTQPHASGEQPAPLVSENTSQKRKSTHLPTRYEALLILSSRGTPCRE